MSETQQKKESVLDVLKLGVRTWNAEMRWLIKSALTRFEINRLEKELNREYGTLGRIAESPRGKMDEKELSLKQIEFLKEEIATLRGELVRDREERMSKLREENQG